MTHNTAALEVVATPEEDDEDVVDAADVQDVAGMLYGDTSAYEVEVVELHGVAASVPGRSALDDVDVQNYMVPRRMAIQLLDQIKRSLSIFSTQSYNY